MSVEQDIFWWCGVACKCISFHSDGCDGDKFMGDGQGVLTLSCHCCGEDDCRCADGNEDDSLE